VASVDGLRAGWDDDAVDTERFRDEVRVLFEADGSAPKDRRFRAVMDDVPGMASENKLAMLNLAASLLPPGEAYLEVGSWKGLSTISAMLGNATPAFYALEKFRECGSRDEVLPDLLANLERWGVRDRLKLVQRDAFRALTRPDWLGHPVGVYFYDGDHGRLAHYLALGLAEPLLADEALVIVDDTSWPVVARATDRYVDSHPGYDLLYSFEGQIEFDPRWWNGVRVYAFRRDRSALAQPSPAVARRRPFDLAWRRILHLYAYEPATWVLFRAMRSRPLAATLRRVLPLKGRRVTPAS